MKHIILTATLILIFFSVKSQEYFVWKTQYFSFFDNREYFNSYIQPQTIFGSRIDFSAGISIDSVHHIQAGADYMYEFGSDANSIPLIPTLYYSFSNKRFEINIGAFPRDNKLQYPNLLLTDTLIYYRPNIEGALLKIKGKVGFQNFWADWVGRQTNTDNESFLAGSSGSLTAGKFFIENYLYMYHLAGTAIRDSSFHIRDNGGGLLSAGIDLRKRLFFKIAVGAALSYDRYRPDPYRINKGFYGNLQVEYKRFALNFIHYNGEALSLEYGDQFYKAKKYTRIDSEINLIKHKNVYLKFQFALHLFDKDINTSQLVVLKANINGHRKINLTVN